MATKTSAPDTSAADGAVELAEEADRLVAIVGNPNVGKSVIFQALTGIYATVSNYPGTTVEVTRGTGSYDDESWRIIDTPGTYSLLPGSEDERVAQQLLFEKQLDVVVHVVDAKNLQRMLPLTIQLLEAGLPVILVLNIMDEAEQRGISVDAASLERKLGIPVVETVSTAGRGIEELKRTIADYEPEPADEGLIQYEQRVEDAVVGLSDALRPDLPIRARAAGLLILQDHPDFEKFVRPAQRAKAEKIAAECRGQFGKPLSYLIASRRHDRASDIAAEVTTSAPDRKRLLNERISDFLINPWTGIPVVLLILYFGLYKFVGSFGAGVVVDYIEINVFEQWLNPAVAGYVEGTVPWPTIQELIAGEYGVFTLGVRYAVAIILPIVGFFFLVFSIMEDSGYLPRLAFLIDRIFKKIGLSGRAVIPVVLGLGCDTMATMVTRTLETTRERILTTMLLALAVPCSAQLGVILALLHGRPVAFAIWVGAVAGIFLIVGYLSARLLPGHGPRFRMELPPLRLPRVGNIITKTYTRIHWYLREVLPLFLFASVLIWLGELTGVFQWALKVLSYPVQWIGLPANASEAFLFGFFRRDYGAAGLYDLAKSEGLTGVQLTVATVALTLFLPCIAQFLMNIKERGAKLGLAISGFALVVSFTVGWLLNTTLQSLEGIL